MIFRRNILLLLCLLFSLISIGCKKVNVFDFDVDSGPAAITFRKLAEQSDVGVVFNSKEIDHIITNTVQGEMPLEDAIKRMIKNTDLIYDHDTEAKLISINKKKS